MCNLYELVYAVERRKVGLRWLKKSQFWNPRLGKSENFRLKYENLKSGFENPVWKIQNFEKYYFGKFENLKLGF